VLSFPADLPPGVPLAHLGDIVVCAPVVRDEAREQGKAAEAHWAHMLIHGTLHLVGYDHIAEADARRMEALESRVLADLGWPCPYGRERAAPTAEAL
jgi:probable rRNA maturation factor